MDKQALLETVLEAREKVEDLESRLSIAKEEKEKVQVKLIEAMDDAHEKSVKIRTRFGLQAITRTEKLYVSVNKDHHEELLKWIDEECGRPDMIKQSVHPSTLTSFINNRLGNAEPVPAFVGMYFKPGLRIAKAKS